jgi:glycosyltransferase involved in cell wall biosynthesis
VNVLYVLKRYPRLSETFVVREIVGVEAQGATVAIDVLLTPEDEPRHPEVDLVRAEVRHLPRQRWSREVAIAALRVGARAPRSLFREWRTAGAAQHAGDHRAGRRLRHAVLVADRARREHVDVIHAHFATSASEVATAAGRLSGIPVTVTAHAKDIYHHDNEGPLATRLADAATVVTVSEHNVQHLAEVAPSTRVRLVRNGVALGPVAADPAASGAGPVLCVSRLVPKKGIDTLLAAIAVLAEDDSSARLEVIGGGPLLDELRAQAETLGVTDRVVLHGPQPSTVVEQAYARAGVVALACRVDESGDRDGLPTVLVEALGRGLPVVSTRLVGIPELVRHEETGLLVPPDDPVALADALRRLRTDSRLASEVGAAGRRLVGDEYDPAGSATALLAVWAEAAS